MVKIAAICKQNEAVQIKVATTPEEADEVMTAQRPGGPFPDASDHYSRGCDRAARPDRPMVAAIQDIAQRYGLNICTFGHAGDGNLHPTCMTDARNHEEIEQVEEAFAGIFAAALELGGTITGEHGVGIVKAPYPEWKAGAAGIEVMKGIKHAFDPHNLLNPGKMFAKETRNRVVVSRA